MAKLSIGQKAERLLKLLLGLRNKAVAQALARYGFTESILQEGWDRLRGLTTAGRMRQAPRRDPLLLQKLDEWQNHWFPIVAATLRTCPKVHDFVFLKLGQTEGLGVILSVETLITRIEQLASEPSLGVEGAQARKLLAARGVSAESLLVARDLLKALDTSATAVPAPTLDQPAQQAAEKAMWDWYLEWAEITRVAVKDRRLLRELGLLSTKRAAKGAAAAPPADEPELPVELRDGNAA